MTTRTGGAPAARKQLSPVDGLAQLSFLIQGLLERRAAEQDLSIIQTRLLGVLRDRTPTMNELYRSFRVGSTNTLANDALTPETSWGPEVGYTIRRARWSTSTASCSSGASPTSSSPACT